jgi:hypothetical protein
MVVVAIIALASPMVAGVGVPTLEAVDSLGMSVSIPSSALVAFRGGLAKTSPVGTVVIVAVVAELE